jgi:carbonic anhydrase/acetyltransferase-like protein (isoleucine patch superfamily)
MSIREYRSFRPKIGRDCYVDEDAVLIGDVELMDNVTIWPGAVLRGDTVRIVVGPGSNVQDNAVLHGGSLVKKADVIIGADVTIGHGVILHGCKIGDNTLVGMGAIVLEDAVVGKNCIVGAGTLVPQNKQVPDGSLAVGSPFTVIRQTRDDERQHILVNAEEYRTMGRHFREGKE